MFYSINPSRNFRAWISSACGRLCTAAPFAVAALALLVLAAPVQAQTTDYDTDDDNLIEVSTLAQLNAIRWDLNGDGTVDNSGDQNNYDTAFPSAVSGMGCSSACTGYELTADLDFGHGAQVARDVDSQIVADLAAGTYTIEATNENHSNSIGTFTLTVSGLGRGSTTLTAIDTCGDTLTSDGSVSGTWAAGCDSVAQYGLIDSAMDDEESNRNYSLARFYTFTLAERSEVIISLESQNRDPYLYLRAGDARSGDALHDNQDVDRPPHWNLGLGWDPIGVFSDDSNNSNDAVLTGVFEGNGYSITNLYINRPSTDAVGLFTAAGTSGKIRNLALVNVSVQGDDQVGALVGNSEGSILRVYSTGRVSGNEQVGGLVGLSDGSIAVAWSSAVVSGVTVGGGVSGEVGGLVGRQANASGSTIIACYAAGPVSGHTAVGGLVGAAYGTVTASYATGVVSGTDGLGGLAGHSFISGVSINGTFNDVTFDTETSGRLFGLGDDDSNNNNMLEPNGGDDPDTPANECERTDPPPPAACEVNRVMGQTSVFLQEGWVSGIAGDYPSDTTNFYYNWNVDVDGDDSDRNNPWYFPNRAYPRLRTDFNGDGTVTYQEFGPQHDYSPPAAPTGVTKTVETNGDITVTWTAPTDTGGLLISGYKVEYSSDGGANWDDATHTGVGTTATISDLTDPDTYRVRVAAVSAEGTGPFTEAETANTPPTANAGPDQTVNTGATVTLDGSGSSDPDSGTTLTYTWTAPSGITLSDTPAAKPTFTAPSSPTTLVFSLVVNDGTANSAPDTVTITVQAPPPPPPPPPPPVGGGNGGGGNGGGGGGGSRDLHGNTPAQATTLTFRPASPRRATANGQISPAGDVDYLTIEIPRAGLLIVETTGRTDTAGTVWQHDEELATARQGGERRNFRLSTPVTAGLVLIAVTGNGNRTGAYTLVVRLVVGFFENPRPGSAQSGIGVLSGWVCEAEEVMLEFVRPDDSVWAVPAAIGTTRPDTEPECGDTDNGFGLLWNWNRLGAGTHTVRALVDGEVWAEHPLTVTTLGITDADGHEMDFPRGLSGTYAVADFPDAGATTTLEWQQALQNFVIAPTERAEDASGETGAQHTPATALLENPQPGSAQSGIGVISGWKCDCEDGVIEIEFENLTTGATQTETVGYGTQRPDTDAPCGDTDNGFGLLWNWNRLGEGEHIVRVSADGEEFAWSRVTVTTLGEEFARGLAGTATLADFPTEGQAVTVEWQQALQNFTITGRQ